VSSASTKQDVTHPTESSLHHYSTADRTEPVPPVFTSTREGRPVSSASTKQDVTHSMESSLHHYSTADRTEPVPPVFTLLPDS